jgi:hypothetical protein
MPWNLKQLLWLVNLQPGIAQIKHKMFVKQKIYRSIYTNQQNI